MVLPWQPNRGSFELASIAVQACPVVVAKSHLIFEFFKFALIFCLHTCVH